VRISQIFLNLLNNAAKYTEPGGTIWITARREDTGLVVSIKDTGIGIDPQKLPQIFESFVQIEKESRPSGGGLGIGLGLVKTLVELHGGTIAAFSEGLGKGSEFVVRLPVAADQSATAAPPIHEEPTPNYSKRCKVLIVDDHMDSAEALKLVLTQNGFVTLLAHDGKGAIQAAKEHQPEAALVDIGLPDISGYEVARALRQMLPKIQLIAISGWNREEDRKSSTEAGFDHHLVKPVDLSEILQLFSECH
jgi:CheY-like chemotaxis protein